jgi:signal peptide peptidase-like protein 3
MLPAGITSIAAGSSLVFCLSPIASQIAAKTGVIDQTAFRCWCGSLSRGQTVLSLLSTVGVALWLVTGHWILNNTLGIAICIAFISHVKLPNVKICALLLSCLFFYDIFWVFFSEHFFGSNVMVVVATQQAQNPVHTVADSLNIPVSAAVTKKLDLPVKLVFPRDLFGGGGSGEAQPDYMMLGLGDMVGKVSETFPTFALYFHSVSVALRPHLERIRGPEVNILGWYGVDESPQRVSTA